MENGIPTETIAGSVAMDKTMAPGVPVHHPGQPVENGSFHHPVPVSYWERIEARVSVRTSAASGELDSSVPVK
jgi:hypothetical protein